MKYILGTKEYMTQIFNDEGAVIPVTLIKVAPAVVTQVKSKENDGYQSIQVGFGAKKEKNANKPLKGHLKDLGMFQYLREVRLDKEKDAAKNMKKDWTVGDKIEPTVFVIGDEVEVSANSKAKGFQGVVKRHGFKGGPRSHGQKHSEREPGSIGTAGFQRVFKARRMAGRMGGNRITTKNLTIVKVDAEKNEIYIRGAVPGRKGTLVEIKG